MKRETSRNPRSLGEMISSVAFLGMGGWLFLEAMRLMGEVPMWRTVGLFLCAFFCVLGAFRFVIAGLWNSVTGTRKK